MPPSPHHYRPSRAILELGEGFYDPVQAATFPESELRFRNDRWAERVGLDSLDVDEWKEHFWSFHPLPDSLEEPLALRYHGHQFRSYNTRLGDGRGFLFAQLRDDRGRLLDLGTKGSGTTPYSRGGDGRLTLQGGVREVLASEMLEALGVETSKSFSLFETGEALQRNDEPSPTRSCVLVRLSHSHIRFGSFQRHAHEGSAERLAHLLDYCVEHFFPGASAATTEATAKRFLEHVLEASARTTARWMAAGFVHGVLNTDNLNITGESFDYGPWRFLPTYDGDFVAAYFDHGGLYRYGLQPNAVLWNLARLADALAPLCERGVLVELLERFDDVFWQALIEAYRERLGVASRGAAQDEVLVASALDFLATTQMPFQQLFFDLYGGIQRLERACQGPSASAYDDPSFFALRQSLRHYEPREDFEPEHPYFAERERPCDLLNDEVRGIWAAIAHNDDWEPFEAKVRGIRQMGEALGLDRGSGE